MDASLARAREILDLVKAEERRRVDENGGRRLPRAQESELRQWAIARYTEAIQLAPSLVEAFVKRGADLYFEHRRQEAEADMRKALSLDPTDAALYLRIHYPFEGPEKRRVLERGMALSAPSSIEYEQLRYSHVNSYWYEGDFREYVRLLEEWIPQLAPSEFMHSHLLGNLAQGYTALGEPARAEATYSQALAATTGVERGRFAEMIIRTRMHREAYAEALQAMAELRLELTTDSGTMFEAALRVLLDAESPDTRAIAQAALPIAEPVGRRPGPVGNRTSYYSFLLGLIYKGAGRRDAARELLRLFAAEFAANKREWAITLRWEIAKALAEAGA